MSLFNRRKYCNESGDRLHSCECAIMLRMSLTIFSRDRLATPLNPCPAGIASRTRIAGGGGGNIYPPVISRTKGRTGTREPAIESSYEDNSDPSLKFSLKSHVQGQGQIKCQRQGFRIFRHRLRGVNSNSWSRGLTINLFTYNTDVDCDHHSYRCFERRSSVQPFFPSSPICLPLTHAANAGGQRTIRETGAQLWTVAHSVHGI